MQHAPGRFAIAVENSTLSGEYTLRLKAEDGTILNEFHVLKGSSALLFGRGSSGGLVNQIS